MAASSAIGTPIAGGEYVGSVGQLISAVLQTAGLFAQSDIIKTFEPILNNLAALVYVVAVIGGIFSVALFGRYKEAMYLLMGPALFTWTLTTTVPGGGTVVRIGSRYVPQAGKQQADLLKMFGDEGAFSDIPQISWLFRLYDNVISEIVQGTVAVLVDTDNNADLLIVARERAMSETLLTEGTDQSFVRIVGMSAVGQCAELSAFRSLLAEPKFKDPDTHVKEEAYRKWIKEKKVEMQKTISILKKKKVVHFDPSLVNYLKLHGITAANPATCEDLWKYSEKLCKDLAGKVLLDVSERAGQTHGLTTDEVLNEMVQAFGDGDPIKARDLLSTHIMRNTIGATAHSGFIEQAANHTPFEKTEYNFMFNNMSNHFSSGERMKLVYWAATIPYLQGLLLFLLAAAFPFFCIFLLVPSKVSGFFMWAALWAWVKSWDVGFAVIYFVREFLWQFMEKNTQASLEQFDTAWEDPGSVLGVLSQVDATANFHLYYTLISLLTLSVPVLTGHLILGASNMFDSFKTHIDKSADRFGTQTANMSRNREVARHLTARQQIKGEAGRKKAAEAEEQARNGQMRDSNGRDLTKSSGADAARRIHGAQILGAFNAHFGDAAAQKRQMIGSLQARTMTYSSGMHKDTIATAVNRGNEERYRTGGEVTSWGATNSTATIEGLDGGAAGTDPEPSGLTGDNE